MIDLDELRLKQICESHSAISTEWEELVPLRASFREARFEKDALNERKSPDSILRIIETSVGEVNSVARVQRVELDHCPVDGKSLAQRLLRMYYCGDMMGTLLCIGDNDHLAPVAAATELFQRIVVVDRDEAVLSRVSALNLRLGGPTIELHSVDLRDEKTLRGIIGRLERSCTTVTCDPPYTTAGYMAFMRLAVEALRLEGSLHIIVPFMLMEPWTSTLLHDVEHFAVRAGMTITDAWRGSQSFQVGAGVVASHLRMQRVALSGDKFQPPSSSFYTMEANE